MTLAAKLDALREGSAKRIPEDKRAVMHRATDDLRKSGILDRVAKVGDPLPPFALNNAQGTEVKSADLLAKGAVVLTVFRGSW
ncbi:MAG: peroxiredoxin family protein [Alphaproteobacteria bacterium]|nr:peroxiredoxin family protein [Alphaproteobacteria bacterium]